MSDPDVNQLYAELKQLGVKIDNLTDLFNRAAYGDGFNRCASHAGRLDHLESGVALCHSRIGAVKKWLIAGLVSVVSLLANVLWNLLRSSLHNS